MEKDREGKLKSEKWEEKAYAFFQDILKYCIFQDIEALISGHLKCYDSIKGPEDKGYNTLCCCLQHIQAG